MIKEKNHCHCKTTSEEHVQKYQTLFSLIVNISTPCYFFFFLIIASIFQQVELWNFPKLSMKHKFTTWKRNKLFSIWRSYFSIEQRVNRYSPKYFQHTILRFYKMSFGSIKSFKITEMIEIKHFFSLKTAFLLTVTWNTRYQYSFSPQGKFSKIL